MSVQCFSVRDNFGVCTQRWDAATLKVATCSIIWLKDIWFYTSTAAREGSNTIVFSTDPFLAAVLKKIQIYFRVLFLRSWDFAGHRTYPSAMCSQILKLSPIESTLLARLTATWKSRINQVKKLNKVRVFLNRAHPRKSEYAAQKGLDLLYHWPLKKSFRKCIYASSLKVSAFSTIWLKSFIFLSEHSRLESCHFLLNPSSKNPTF